MARGGSAPGIRHKRASQGGRPADHGRDRPTVLLCLGCTSRRSACSRAVPRRLASALSCRSRGGAAIGDDALVAAEMDETRHSESRLSQMGIAEASGLDEALHARSRLARRLRGVAFGRHRARPLRGGRDDRSRVGAQLFERGSRGVRPTHDRTDPSTSRACALVAPRPRRAEPKARGLLWLAWRVRGEGLGVSLSGCFAVPRRPRWLHPLGVMRRGRMGYMIRSVGSLWLGSESLSGDRRGGPHKELQT